MSRSGLGPGPLSPLSPAASHDSFGPRYGSFGGTPNDTPYSGGPYGVARPPLTTSPPGSNHPSGSTDSSRPSGSGSSMNGGRPPSSASSLGGRSDGRMGFGGPPGVRDSGRGRPDNEEVLHKHYRMLRGYLAASLRDEKGNLKPNKARDKLLRLSVTQFMELSTDVYDELIRREDHRTGRVPNVPPSLPPKRDFHPKRNQARQKLSTLPTDRFRQLATDVFYELERRIPRFATGDMDRPMSGASGRSMRGPPYRGPPPGPGGRPPMGPPHAPYQSFRPASPGPNGAPPGAGRRPTIGSETSNFGRPLPKTSQSHTIVPNKSTMVEEDDDDDEGDDTFGLVSERFSKATNAGDGGASSERVRAQEAEIAELKKKMESLESNMLDKEQELENVKGSLHDKEQELERVQTSGAGFSAERDEWHTLREELEQKHVDAQLLNESLQREIDLLKDSKSQQLQAHEAESEELRQQLHSAQQTADDGSHERHVAQLQEELASQEKLTHTVRDEAMQYLQEMRQLSRQNDYAVEQEEKLATRVSQLEREIDNWRRRYAKVKAQNKSLRASTMGLGLQTTFDSGSLVRQEGLVSDSGLVRDVDVTRFQTAVDELLKVARQPDTQPMLDGVKNVVVSVQSMTAAVGTDGYPTPSPSPLSPGSQRRQPESVSKLKARVTGTANSLITATKQHATASGLSPVVLLDAAASNLTASVIELIKAVGIRPSAGNELLSDAEPSEYGDDNDMTSFYDEQPSPPDGSPGAGPTAVPRMAPSVQASSAAPATAAPLSVGRSNTTKKTNGWFGGWGKKSSVDETSTLNGNAYADEYDPYR